MATANIPMEDTPPPPPRTTRRNSGKKFIYSNPVVGALPLPEDVTPRRWGQANIANRIQPGYYQGHNFAMKSSINQRTVKTLKDVKKPRGLFECPLCRSAESNNQQAGWQDVQFRPSQLYTDIPTLDAHVIAYHLPFIRYFACEAKDNFACLSLKAIRKHFEFDSPLHRRFPGFPDSQDDSFASGVKKFAEDATHLDRDPSVRVNPYYRVPHIPMNVEIRPNYGKSELLTVCQWNFMKLLFTQRIGVADCPAMKALDLLADSKKMADMDNISKMRDSIADMIPCAELTRDGIIFRGPMDTPAVSIHRLTKTGHLMPASPSRPLGSSPAVDVDFVRSKMENVAESIRDAPEQSPRERRCTESSSAQSAEETAEEESIVMSDAMAMAAELDRQFAPPPPSTMLRSLVTSPEGRKTRAVTAKRAQQGPSRQATLDCCSNQTPVATPAKTLDYASSVKQKKIQTPRVDSVAQTDSSVPSWAILPMRTPQKQPSTPVSTASTPQAPSLEQATDDPYNETMTMPQLDVQTPCCFDNRFLPTGQKPSSVAETSFRQPVYPPTVTPGGLRFGKGIAGSANIAQDKTFLNVLTEPGTAEAFFVNFPDNLDLLPETEKDSQDMTMIFDALRDFKEQQLGHSLETNFADGLPEEQKDPLKTRIVFKNNMIRIRNFVTRMADLATEDATRIAINTAAYRSGSQMYAIGQAHCREEWSRCPRCPQCINSDDEKQAMYEELVQLEETLKVRMALDEKKKSSDPADSKKIAAQQLELDTLGKNLETLTVQMSRLQQERDDQTSSNQALCAEKRSLNDSLIVLRDESTRQAAEIRALQCAKEEVQKELKRVKGSTKKNQLIEISDEVIAAACAVPIRFRPKALVEATNRLEGIVREVIEDNIFEEEDDVQNIDMTDFEDAQQASEQQTSQLDVTSGDASRPDSHLDDSMEV